MEETFCCSFWFSRQSRQPYILHLVEVQVDIPCSGVTHTNMTKLLTGIAVSPVSHSHRSKAERAIRNPISNKRLDLELKITFAPKFHAF